MIRIRYTLAGEVIEIRAANAAEAWAQLKASRPEEPVFRADRMAEGTIQTRLSDVLANQRGESYMDALFTLATTGFAVAVWAMVAAMLMLG